MTLNNSVCEITSFTNEILIKDVWIPFDGYGRNTEESREFYSKAFVQFAEGSYKVRTNGFVQTGLSPSDSIFYVYRVPQKSIKESSLFTALDGF